MGATRCHRSEGGEMDDGAFPDQCAAGDVVADLARVNPIGRVSGPVWDADWLPAPD